MVLAGLGLFADTYFQRLCGWLCDADHVLPQEGVDFEAFERMIMSVDHSILSQRGHAQQMHPEQPCSQRAPSSHTEELSQAALSCSSDEVDSPVAHSPSSPHATAPHSNGNAAHAPDIPSSPAHHRAENGGLTSYPVSLSSQASTSMHSPSLARDPCQPQAEVAHPQPTCSTSEITPLHDGLQPPAFLRRGSSRAGNGPMPTAHRTSPDANGRRQAHSTAMNGSLSPRPEPPEAGLHTSSGQNSAGMEGQLSSEQQHVLAVMKSIDDAWMSSFLL